MELALIRARVSPGRWKQLAEVEEQHGNRSSGGVMVIPRMASSVDEWQALAMASQEELTAQARDEAHGAVDNRNVLPAPPPDPNIEHERLYQEHRRQVAGSTREYLQAKVDAVRKATAP